MTKPGRRTAWVLTALLIGGCMRPSSVRDVALSPAAWDPDELEELRRVDRELRNPNDGLWEVSDFVATGENGVVTGTSGALAVGAGLEALRQGGSAADAAMTTALAQVVLAAGSWVSFAGMLTMVYYDAETGRTHSMNAAFNTVLGEDDPMTIPRLSEPWATVGGEPRPSGRAVLVPGFMAGVEAAHQRFGKLPFAEIFAPAIYFADNGFELNVGQPGLMKMREKELSRLPETRRIFTRPDGTFYEEGDVFRQPELARTLRKVAEEGARRHMYQGEWAHKLVDAVNREGGKMSLEDLERYEPLWLEPVRAGYGDFEVMSQGLPATGGVHLAEALHVAAEADLAGMGHYLESAEAFFWLHQVTSISGMSYGPEEARRKLLDGADASLEARASREHARRLWVRMRDGRFPLTRTPKEHEPAPRHSDGVVAIDRWGNIATVVHSINGPMFGEIGIFVDGISIPDPAGFQQLQVREAGPGRRLGEATMPLIVFRDSRPVAAFSAIGSGLFRRMIAVLLNLMDAGMDVEQAIATPSPHMSGRAADGSVIAQVLEGEIRPELLARVAELGLEVKEFPKTRDSNSKALFPRGTVIGASIDPQSRLRTAVGTPGMNGCALGH